MDNVQKEDREYPIIRRVTSYSEYPGIAGKFNTKGDGGVERNFLRHIIFLLIRFNNYLEERGQ